MIQKELLNPGFRRGRLCQAGIIAGTVETGQPQVVDVFDGKIVFRKPIDDSERGGSSRKKARENV